MSELLVLEEEPGRTCGHDECQHGGCKGPTIDKVKAANCPIGTEIRRCRADNKRKAKVLKAAAAEAKNWWDELPAGEFQAPSRWGIG